MLELLCDVFRRNALDIQSCDFPVEDFTPLALMLLPILMAKPVTHFCPRPGTRQVTKFWTDPVTTGLRLASCDYFDLIPVLDSVRERHNAPVHLCATAAMSNLRMDVVREIEGRCLRRQLHYVAFRTDGVYAIFKEIAANLLEQVSVIVSGLEQLPQETNLLIKRGARGAAFLVSPVCRDAELCMLMHLLRANLNLNCLAIGANNGRVQRPVVVLFRIRDVIVELARNVRPQVVHDTQGCIARVDIVNEYAHGANVVQRIEAQTFALHFSPNTVDVLGSAGDRGRHLMFFEFAVQCGLVRLNELLPFDAFFL